MNLLRRSLVLRFLIIAAVVIMISFLAQFMVARGSIWQSVEQYYRNFGNVTVRYAAAFMYDQDCADPDEETKASLESLSRLCRETDVDYIVYEPLTDDGERFYVSIIIDEFDVLPVSRPEDEADDDWFMVDEKERTLQSSGTIISGWYTVSDADRRARSEVYTDSGIDNPDLNGNTYLMFAHAVNDNEGRMNAIVRVWISTAHVMDARNRELFHTIGVGMAISFVLLLLLTLYIYLRMLVPIRKFSLKMAGFVSGNGLEQEKMPVRGKDEIAQMARSYNTMTDNISHYVSEIDSMTRAREEMNAELRISAQIQKGLLPGKSYSDDHVSVSAVMEPAKYVGGDFYDFFALDNGKVCAVIADVSGKGVSAAMFMSSAVMMIRYIAGTGLTPGQILEKVNRDLCKNNPELRFITVFLAVFDPAERILTYANAGHNLPYLISPEPVQLAGGSGTMLGVFPDEKWEDTAVEINGSGCLFMYTDGVTEAVNPRNELFGDERLKDVLANVCEENGPRMEEKIISAVSAEVTEFTGGAEQNDDITMVCMHFKPRHA